MPPYRPGQRVEFPAERPHACPRVVRVGITWLLVVGGMVAFVLVAELSRPHSRDVYVQVTPDVAWVSQLSVTCTGGDSFDVGYVAGSHHSEFLGPSDRYAVPYFLTSSDARGVERTYPLCVGGYTLDEAGWGLELRAWWSLDGQVKRLWVTVRPAMPDRQTQVLGALNTENGDYWSAQGWRNDPAVSWRERDLDVDTWANPMSSPVWRDDCPTWALPDGGQLLARLAVPSHW